MSRIMQEDLKNRAKGALWGLVIGDCLGSPIQFSEKDNHPFITEMVPCEIFRTPAGYWTDDASMAFCIIESYIRLKKYDLEDIASNFVKWYNSGFMSSMPYAFDVGGATDYAIQCIEKKSMKNGNEQTQGNGSIMRFAPSYFISNKEKEKNIIFDISDLTHNSSVVRNVVLKLSDTISEHLQGVRTSNKSRYSNLKPLAGAVIGAGVAMVASAKIFKHSIIPNNNLLPKSTVRDVSEMLLMAGGANIGGVIAGSIGASAKQKKKKYKEAMFQIMNTSIPMLLVTGAIKTCESVKALNKNSSKIIASIAAMLSGAAIATGITNATKKETEPERKYTIKDSLANFDDIVATIKLGFKKVTEYIPVDVLLPIIYIYNGYRSGSKE